ncbi:MAG: TIGR03943 family putative permease subunit [Desulfomonilaceae bacterium]
MGTKQSLNWLGLVQAAVLTGWVIALGWLAHGSGDDALLGRFLRSSYWWIVYIAVWVFVALLASLIFNQPRQLGLDRRRSLIQAIILALPLLYMPYAVGSELSIEAAEKRSLFTSRVSVKRSDPGRQMAAIPESGTEAAPKSSSPQLPRTAVKQSESPKRPKTQLIAKAPSDNSHEVATSAKSHKPTLWDLVSNPEDFTGTDATIIGMVYKGKGLSADSFFCYRLLMVCCAADASPAGVIVKWPAAARLDKGAWVKVDGKVGFTTFDGEDYPMISATKVEKTHPPKNRFLIPK